MTYDNTNTGTLNRNDRKEKETHADYRGQINIGGVEYWLDGWIKTAGANAKAPGSKFLSLRAKPKDAAAAAPRQQSQPAKPDFDDDIPF